MNIIYNITTLRNFIIIYQLLYKKNIYIKKT